MIEVHVSDNFMIDGIAIHVSMKNEGDDMANRSDKTLAPAFAAMSVEFRALAAERFWHGRIWDAAVPVHIRATDAKASLALFTYSKDTDPVLQVIIDTVAIPIQAAGRPASVSRLAITLQAPDGTRLALHDQRDPAADPLGTWRKTLRGIIGRTLPGAAPALSLNATQLARWSAAVRGAERLAMFHRHQSRRTDPRHRRGSLRRRVDTGVIPRHASEDAGRVTMAGRTR